MVLLETAWAQTPPAQATDDSPQQERRWLEAVSYHLASGNGISAPRMEAVEMIEAMPDRLYVIDRAGKVAYQGGRGPFGFKTGEMEQSLILVMLEDARAKTTPVFPVAPIAPKAPATAPRVPPLEQNEALKRLPKLEKPISAPLPIWARMLAASLPQTTAAMLELDYLHGARSPLNPVVRGTIRWVAAEANSCGYTKAPKRTWFAPAWARETVVKRQGNGAREAREIRSRWRFGFVGIFLAMA